MKGEQKLTLSDKLKKISEGISKKIEIIETEEATKNAFIMPFILALGYDVFDPAEVVPEFISDAGTKRGEKVDYAILQDDEPAILIECKSCNSDLDIKHASQLFRYFTVTSARFAILTNGIIYQFFEIDITQLKDSQIEELKKFTKDSFDQEEILKTASDLKFTSQMKKIMRKELTDPSDNFVKFFTKKVYSGIVTERVRLKFKGITKNALNEIINDHVSMKLKSALEASEPTKNREVPEVIVDQAKEVFTTAEELEGFYIIKTILHENVSPERVFIREIH